MLVTAQERPGGAEDSDTCGIFWRGISKRESSSPHEVVVRREEGGGQGIEGAYTQSRDKDKWGELAGLSI